MLSKHEQKNQNNLHKITNKGYTMTPEIDKANRILLATVLHNIQERTDSANTTLGFEHSFTDSLKEYQKTFQKTRLFSDFRAIDNYMDIFSIKLSLYAALHILHSDGDMGQRQQFKDVMAYVINGIHSELDTSKVEEDGYDHYISSFRLSRVYSNYKAGLKNLLEAEQHCSGNTPAVNVVLYDALRLVELERNTTFTMVEYGENYMSGFKDKANVVGCMKIALPSAIDDTLKIFDAAQSAQPKRRSNPKTQ